MSYGVYVKTVHRASLIDRLDSATGFPLVFDLHPLAFVCPNVGKEWQIPLYLYPILHPLRSVAGVLEAVRVYTCQPRENAGKEGGDMVRTGDGATRNKECFERRPS